MTSTPMKNSGKKCVVCGENCGRPALLDLFSGAGGAAYGYRQAGFCVLGIDTKPQPRYAGCRFHCADAFAYLEQHGHEFDVIHASPPCQAYTVQGRTQGKSHPQLIEPIRDLLRIIGKPYVIENVMGAPLINPITLCGSMFRLGVLRHRKFESNLPLPTPPSCCHGVKEIRGYYGNTGREAFRAKKPGNKDTLRGTVLRAPEDMGIDWMDWKELTQAIPPAYTEWIGRMINKL